MEQQPVKNEVRGGAHSIGIAARYSGLSTGIIRAWERRYKVVAPGRTAGARRTYTDADIERLALLAKVTAAGRRIGDVADLPNERLSEMIAKDQAVAVSAPGERQRQSTAAVMEYFNSCIQAVDELDAHGCIATLARAERALGTMFLIEDLITPLLAHVRDECRRGALSNGHKRLFTGAVAARLLMLAAANDHPRNRAVVGAVERDPELSALKIAAVANANGWNPVYIGERAVPGDVADTACAARAQAVVIGASALADDDDVPNQLRILRRLLPDAPLIVHTPTGGHYPAIVGEINAIHCNNLRQLRFEMAKLTT